MTNFKYIFRKNKRSIMIMFILLICSVAIAIGIYAQVDKNRKDKLNVRMKTANYEDLKNNFENIFIDDVNIESTAKLNINYKELIFCQPFDKEKKGKYKINAKIPFFKEENEELKRVNQEIFDVFSKKISDITTFPSANTTYSVNYVVYVNNNIISLAIRCKLKEGSSPQREIIQTYNYNIDDKKIMNIDDMLEYKRLDKDKVQNRISNEIRKINSEKEKINNQGFNVYKRDEGNLIYKVENTPNFFLGKNNYLYLVYAYGNRNYTTEKDLVIF